MAHQAINWHGFDPFNPSTWLPNFGLWGGVNFSAGVATDTILPEHEGVGRISCPRR